jgi:hypothetical protein
MSLRKQFIVYSLWFMVCLVQAMALSSAAWAQENRAQPIIVNGDQVEYSSGDKEVLASGKVEVIYKGAKLTCSKMTVNTQTKDAVAEGGARLEDENGVIEGEKIIYNLQSRAGTIIDAGFRANPYFGRARKIERVSETEFIARRGYATTCSFDRPHYRIKSRRITVFPGDKIRAEDNLLYIGKIPLLYLPKYNHSLKDPLMHVQVMPGKRKDWGPYLLTAWRYNLNPHLDGRVYLDYRERLGLAYGFGLNYVSPSFGKGDFKFYYSSEKPRSLPQGSLTEYDRYLLRLRHSWELGARTSLTSEIYMIGDEKRKKLDPTSNMLKDYFFREYEKDSQPLSYVLLHHNFSYSSMDLLAQKRVNHWYDQIEKMPEAKYSLPSLQLGDTPFYFENNSSLVNLDKKAESSPVSSDDVTVTRFDTTNKLSLPMKVSFLEFIPFISSRQTIYDKGVEGSSVPKRTIFYSGADLSTKFYRVFDVKSNFLGMDINGLRHVITPSLSYVYNHEPTQTPEKLRQVDSIDALRGSNVVSAVLSNKLQTKRKGVKVDFVDARVSTDYVFDPKTGDKMGSNLSDIIYDLTLIPYAWLRMDADAIYQRSGLRSDPNYNKISTANCSLSLDLGKGNSVGIGQRYQRKGSNEVTNSLQWRLNPKWKFSLYQRRNFGHDTNIPQGLREQEYTLSRDLHCWIMDITFNTKKNEGSAVWFIFRLKAFPEIEFGFNQSYSSPQSGSQNQK